MDLGQALAQVSEIQRVLARAEIYRGYRPRTMAITAFFAAGAGLLQPRYLPHLSAQAFVHFWISIAAASLILVGGEMAFDYWSGYSRTQQRMARRVISHFAPCLAAGALVTLPLQAGQMALLPGLWSVIFSLGVFAARPCLPRGIGWVALYYLVAGVLLLTPTGLTLGSLGMGASFGFGQLFMALTLYWNLERTADHG